MSGAITRKIEISRQIEEAKLLVDEPAVGRTSKIAAERTERRRAIVATLEFCRDHEHEIRAWAAQRKGASE